LRVAHLINAGVFSGPNAVIGDQNVETSEALYRSCDKVVSGFRTRQIAGNRMAAIRAALLNQLLRLGYGLLVVENDARTCLDEKLYGGGANAAGTSCNQGYSVC
jgi:hypothetical protein